MWVIRAVYAAYKRLEKQRVFSFVRSRGHNKKEVNEKDKRLLRCDLGAFYKNNFSPLKTGKISTF